MTFLFLGLKVSFFILFLGLFTNDYKKNLNLMSSWGGRQIFNFLGGVGGIKFEFLWGGKLIFWEGGGIKFEFW